jgi:hypothetical protein
MRILVVIALAVAAVFRFAWGAAAATSAEEAKQEIATWISGLPARWPAEAMKDRNGTIVFRVSGEGGGAWHARLSQGQLAAGSGDVSEPIASVECSVDDFLAIARGQMGAVEAFLSGKMHILGNLDFVREFYAQLLPAAAAPAQVRTDTTGWYPFQPRPIDFASKVAPDASHLLDPPAGKHGFLTVRGDRFVFEDGTSARFWGANIVSGNLFKDHETARAAAARLARFGCNMVRFHGVDVEDLFNPAYDDTQHFSPQSLDRLDYLIYQLKEHGIYVNLGLLVFRNFKAGDGVRDWQAVADKFIAGAKIAPYFDRRMIELQKKYAVDLYTHVNKYTGLRYCDDPAIAMSELINESSMFWINGYGSVPASYIAELNDLYRAWAQARGIVVPAETSVPQGLRARNPDVLQFLYDTQVAYFSEMRDCLRAAGVRVPLAGSNFWEAIPLDLQSNLVMDYIDRHAYWDHPQSGFGWDAGFDNRPMVKARNWNLVTWLAPQRGAGKPLMISEWNTAWINEYIAEGPLTMAAYGAFQGWDGLLTYCYFARGGWADEITDNFDVGSWPHVFSTWPVAARIFLQGLVQPGRAPLPLMLRPDALGQATDDLPDRAGLRRRLAFAFLPPGAEAPAAILPEGGPAVTSDTGQLTWDADAGLITVDAPLCAARIGFASTPAKTGPVTFAVSPEFAVVAVTALDDEPIPESKHLLITATARAENTGMVYGPGKTRALNPGHSPILMEPVRGEIRIAARHGKASAQAYPLDSSGRRLRGTALEAAQGQFVIPLQARACWYEVVVSSE